ncbi:hypothetical protein AVEN_171049-1 [Araneus ventricosus]|uniref:Integrase zinc-binding domain-containing protein n=1 Tax=Araneus ventricosus TaxID=182803 RepID=A0A4Y2N4B7_ARAVE|nr:hypothetical protein AVEN_171049-1 [Araneus ventricosus]
MNITLTDVGVKSQPVQVFIGADLFGRFLTGQRRVLSCGLLLRLRLELAIRRLESTTKKLLHENLYDAYEGIFLEWLHEGIIQEVPVDEINLSGNYLPHRPVLQENSTTPIRPVFDASARMKGHPSLNESLHSGPNLIELIPDILLRFREKKIGVTADIRKAFLQISVCKEDRDFLRFLWWKNKDCQEDKFFRHARVVCGVRSSPFLLEAVLKYHLAKNCDVDPFVTKRLSNSFYVDNLLISVHNESELKHLINVPNELMKKDGFELQNWESSAPRDVNSKTIDLLGLKWNKSEDILSINPKWLKEFRELEALKEVRVPLWINITPDATKKFFIHTFCDASKDAYATVSYLVQESDDKNVHFLASRSRITPFKGSTTPRLELLAALVGARLIKSIVDALGWTTVKSFYWSYSTTVLTQRHVSGVENPADLPSRGCKASYLVKTRFWEGPRWLSSFQDKGPSNDFELDEDEILKERKKSAVSALVSVNQESSTEWFCQRFSKYENMVILVGWITRIVQKETFQEDDKQLKFLSVCKDEDGLLLVNTKIIYRKDTENFRTSVLLPSEHEIVSRLIRFHREKNSHCGVQTLINILRETYWILRGKKSVRKVISSCVICKRYSSKNLEYVAAPLPENRVRDAAVFQITGFDTEGPLFLKCNQQVWVLLFTCAIYRVVHLELMSGVSAEAFLMALRRFVARRGRCSTIYCDNGTNFGGAANILHSLDWKKDIKYGTVDANPPPAAWWGGWWERLIRIMKDLLKRVLGKAYLSHEEMMTFLCNCEAIINSRPLTYVSENDTDFTPISPSMFIQGISEWTVPDLDVSDYNSLSKRIKYRQTVQKDLRHRFRSEYFGQLVQRRTCKGSRPYLWEATTSREFIDL